MGGRLPETTGTAANRKCFVRKHIPRHRPVTGNYRYSNYSTHASDAGLVLKVLAGLEIDGMP